MFQDIKVKMGQYQERHYPELVFSVVDFGKKRRVSDKGYQKNLRGVTPDKERVRRDIEQRIK